MVWGRGEWKAGGEGAGKGPIHPSLLPMQAPRLLTLHLPDIREVISWRSYWVPGTASAMLPAPAHLFLIMR